MHTTNLTHEPAIYLIQSGKMGPGRPTLGSWVVYGLGWEIVIGAGIISLPYLFTSLTQAGSLYDLVTYLAVTSCSTRPKTSCQAATT